jgi:hypothetical protein
MLPWEAHADWSFWEKVFELEFIGFMLILIKL